MLNIKGMSLYDQGIDAYGNNLILVELQKLKNIGVNTVAFTVYFDMHAYTDSSVFYAGYNPSKEWIRQFIKNAHGLGLKVMFKPHVSCDDGRWAGRIYPTDWNAWFASYMALILEYTQLCEEEGVEIICIGNELSSSTGSDENASYPHPTSNLTDPYNRLNWLNLIESVRSVFNGEITYASVFWQVFDDSFPWDANGISYIGINGYFPVSSTLEDSVATIIENWTVMSSSFSRSVTYSNWKKWINDLQRKYNKPVLFTEQSYTTSNPPTIEEEQHQANSFEAFFKVWAENPNVAGVIIWCWCAKDRPIVQSAPWILEMSPQDKLAEMVITDWNKTIYPLKTILKVGLPLMFGGVIVILSRKG